MSSEQYFFSIIAEKDSLLLRNAELSQKCESLKRSAEDDKRDLERDLNGKEAAIAGLEQSIHNLQSQITEQQSKVFFRILFLGPIHIERLHPYLHLVYGVPTLMFAAIQCE